MLKSMSKNGLILATFAVCSTALVAVTSAVTRPLIAKQTEKRLIKNINELFPASSYNNDLFNTCFSLNEPQFLGADSSFQAWLARKDQTPVGIALEAVAPDGYRGNIHLLVGIHYDGSLAGVRVLEHKETPGLGDKIELAKSDWILSFNGKRYEGEKDTRWAVRKDGGEFDAFTGATITPRAVIRATKNTLMYYQLHQESLWQRQPDCGGNHGAS